MSTFAKLSPDKFNQALADVICPQLAQALSSRSAGHCMRVTDLQADVMETVCVNLRRMLSNENIYILSRRDQITKPYHITSTKLVELRNPDRDGNLRPCLLVFIPANLRTSAEDSFGVATFEEITFDGIYGLMLSSLLDRIPQTLAGQVQTLFRCLDEEDWTPADDVARIRYLLTAMDNGIDGETLGASLYELTLMPDFKVYLETVNFSARILRNMSSVRELIDSYKSVRGRITGLGLKDVQVEKNLMAFFDKHDIEEPETWSSCIATEKAWWNISFNKWVFKDDQSLDNIKIQAVEAELPEVTEQESNERISGLVGQKVLVPNKTRKMNVSFEVNPLPNKVRGLDHFTIQIVSQNGGAVGKAKKVKAWTGSRFKCTTSITGLDKVDFDEGWHYIRVTPLTENDDPMPMVDGATIESTPFYVLEDGTVDANAPQRALPIETSLEHALFKLQMAALAEERELNIPVASVSWADSSRARKSAKQDTLHVQFEGEGIRQVLVSRALKDIEQSILSDPTKVFSYCMPIVMGAVGPFQKVELVVPKITALSTFFTARQELFEKIRQGEVNSISQGFLFRAAKQECLAYSTAYIELLNRLFHQANVAQGQELHSLVAIIRSILMLDSVHVILTDYCGRHKEAILLSPTHPLRIQWLSCWTELGDSWFDKIKSGSKDMIPGVRQAFLEILRPYAFPVALPSADGRVFTAIDNMNFFWAIYMPSSEVNTRGLMAEICSALGLNAPSSDVGTDITGDVIADKIERYLAQHPYVRELSINIFNPGSGVVLAEALTQLQQRREYADLRYDLRLFASDPDSPTMGESLESLLHSNNTVNEAVDAFAVSTGSHLFTKLKLGRHDIKEFHANIEKYQAHISIMLDAFPAEELSVMQKRETTVPLFGLIQDFDVDFTDDEAGTIWKKHPIIGHPSAVMTESSDGSFDVLADLSSKLCIATAAVATGGTDFQSIPVVTLSLSVESRELIYEVHQMSDWVFTIDRYMGIEFFDHGGRKNRPDYLIDFIPGSKTNATHNLIISSRSGDELRAMLQPILAERGIMIDSGQASQIMASLRSLSGQLALKLISARSQQAEALGLALARLYLEYQVALDNQIIVPLDAHIDLYRSSKDAESVDDSISLNRTDLALFDLDIDNRIITCNLVEVKCYQDVGDVSSYNKLKESISQQIYQSERVLQRHFDPALKNPDRPDRLLKSRELMSILRFYLERSIRYGIFQDDAAQEAKSFLETIEDGYTLQFRRGALVFDFERNGTESPDVEVGIEYHRIGKDIVRNLLDNCHKQETSADPVVATSQSLSVAIFPTVPKLSSAAFIAPKRNRSKTWTTSPKHKESATYSTDDEGFVGDPENSKHDALVKLSDTSPDSDKRDCILPDVDTPAKETNTDTSNGAKQVESSSECPDVPYDILLGVTEKTPQYGLLGDHVGRKIALDLNGTNTISLFGVQGGGKSYTLGSIVEMATIPIANINTLPSPLATVIFHYSPTLDYAPEFTSMLWANSSDAEIKALREGYHAMPAPLNDILILTPKNKVEERRNEFPGIEVLPISFSASELKAEHWKFLMGAVGNQSMYMRQIIQLMRSLRGNLSLDALRTSIENSHLTDNLQELALTRLSFAAEYINNDRILQDVIRPGRLIIVDLRDEFIEKDEALGLFVVMLQIFSEAKFQGKSFNKLVVFDEAHKYIENADLVAGLVDIVREMRHKGTSILVASQDPPSVPTQLIELSTQIIMHKFNSPAWLKHIQKANAALASLTSEKMSNLSTGEAYVWSSKASDDAFSRGAIKVKCRPRVTQHGGGTKTAVSKQQ
jgi:DNA phosphorothioation-dependent restriction protein DptH